MNQAPYPLKSKKLPRAVIDQPGVKIVFFGLLLSVFIGLSFKSQIKSNKVSGLLRASLLRLENDFKIDFGSAEVKLSDWGIPKPYIVINQIRISHKQSTCKPHQIFVDKLTFPLTWNLLFGENKVIPSLRIGLMEIRIGGESVCLSGGADIEKKSDSKTQSLVEIKGVNKQDFASGKKQSDFLKTFNFRTSAELKEVKIDRVRFILESSVSNSLELRGASIVFDYKQDRLTKIDLVSQLVSFYDQASSTNRLRSELKGIVVFEDLKFNSQFSIIGKMIDRDISLFGNFLSETGQLRVQSELKGLSVKSIIELLGKNDFPIPIRESLSAFALSGKINLEYNFLEDRWNYFSIDSVAVKSSTSTIEIDQFDVRRWLEDKNYKVEFLVGEFELQKMIGALHRQLASSIEDLGVFSGSVILNRSGEIKISGVVRNLFLTFASRGQKIVQQLSSMNIKLNAISDGLKIDFSDFVRENKKIVGFFKLSIPKAIEDKNSIRHVSYDLDLKGELFSPQVVEQFLGEPANLDVHFKLSKDPLSNEASGSFTTDQVSYRSIQFKKPNVAFVLNDRSQFKSVQLSTKAISLTDPTVLQNENKNLDIEKIQNFFNEIQKLKNLKVPVIGQSLQVTYSKENVMQFTVQQIQTQRGLGTLTAVGRQQNPLTSDDWVFDILLKSDSLKATADQMQVDLKNVKFQIIQ